jgi:hypothetical protein
MIGRFCTATLLASIMTCERRIHSGRMGVIHAVMHGTNERHAMHLLSQSRQMLTDRDTSETAGDGIEFAADLRGSFRLHIPHIQMTGSAVQKQHDAMIRSGGKRVRVGEERALSQQARQSGSPNLQHTTAGNFT